MRRTSTKGWRTYTAKYTKIHSGYIGIVEGYQREIAALADAIVAALASPASGMDAPCQQSIEGSAGGSASKDH